MLFRSGILTLAVEVDILKTTFVDCVTERGSAQPTRTYVGFRRHDISPTKRTVDVLSRVVSQSGAWTESRERDKASITEYD